MFKFRNRLADLTAEEQEIVARSDEHKKCAARHLVAASLS